MFPVLVYEDGLMWFCGLSIFSISFLILFYLDHRVDVAGAAKVEQASQSQGMAIFGEVCHSFSLLWFLAYLFTCDHYLVIRTKAPTIAVQLIDPDYAD